MTSANRDQIYCFKCRKKTDTLEAHEVVLKHGRAATTDCSTDTAVCTSNGKKMSNSPQVTIAGP